MSEAIKSLSAVMEEGANVLLRLMLTDTATNGEKIKAFDSLTEYYKAAPKVDGKPDTPENSSSFGEIRGKIESAGNESGGPSAVSGN